MSKFDKIVEVYTSLSAIHAADQFKPIPKESGNKIWIIIGEGQREGEEHVMAVYTDAEKAKNTFARLKKQGYGDHEDFRLESRIANEELFDLDEVED